MNRPVRWYDYLTINSYWLGLMTMLQTLTPLVIPLLVQRFVGDELKGTYYGNLRLWTLMAALLMQALMGMLSDRSQSRWGRRRPFLLLGTLGDLVFIVLIGISAGFSGYQGYWFLFTATILLMLTSNVAHAALQGLIPDLVPLEKRGRFSGVKALLEVPLPLILVSFTIARWIGKGDLWAALIGVMALLLITLAITLTVPEQPLEQTPPPLDWQPLLRLVFMAAAFTGIILATGQLAQRLTQIFSSMDTRIFLPAVVIVGLGAMAAAIVLGVWASLRIGIGAEARQQRSFTWWVINRLAFLVGATNLASFAVYFLQARLGLQREQAAAPAATLTMFVGVFILLSALPGGWLADRFGRKKLVAISGVAAAAGTALTLIFASLPIIYAGSCMIGAGIGLFYTANWALGTAIVPGEQAGRYLGLSNLAGAGAGAIGAYIGGPIADAVTRQMPGQPGIAYVLLFIIYGALFLLSVLALQRVKEPEIIQ